jgi:hypothetical protein
MFTIRDNLDLPLSPPNSQCQPQGYDWTRKRVERILRDIDNAGKTSLGGLAAGNMEGADHPPYVCIYNTLRLLQC